MNARVLQIFGLVLLIVSIAMTLIVAQATMALSGNMTTLIASGMVAWGIVAMPELIVGLWALARGTRAARVGDVSGKLIALVQQEGRIGVGAAARELGVTQDYVADAAEKLARRRFPLVYLDTAKGEIVSPGAVSLQESLLHLLYAHRRMTFDQIARVTNSTDEQIVEALSELSESGKFRGTIDRNSRVVYTAEAVAQLPNAITECPNCGGKLQAPVLPGEEEVCPYCGHMIVNHV
ncbi:MAG: hypothetical protein K9W43_03785 [Candidatus Thorarchaeota archaeon]|nr:hypothetical protein [Candidatus Thorarchaeota archaeon]